MQFLPAAREAEADDVSRAIYIGLFQRIVIGQHIDGGSAVNHCGHLFGEPLVVIGWNTKTRPGDVATNNLYVFQPIGVETVSAEGVAHPFHSIVGR